MELKMTLIPVKPVIVSKNDTNKMIKSLEFKKNQLSHLKKTPPAFPKGDEENIVETPYAQWMSKIYYLSLEIDQLRNQINAILKKDGEILS